MSLQRRVHDFLAIESGGSGLKSSLTAGAMAMGILAATFGGTLPASGADCHPNEPDHHNAHDNHDDHFNYCGPLP